MHLRFSAFFVTFPTFMSPQWFVCLVKTSKALSISGSYKKKASHEQQMYVNMSTTEKHYRVTGPKRLAGTELRIWHRVKGIYKSPHYSQPASRTDQLQTTYSQIFPFPPGPVSETKFWGAYSEFSSRGIQCQSFLLQRFPVTYPLSVLVQTIPFAICTK